MTYRFRHLHVTGASKPLNSIVVNAASHWGNPWHGQPDGTARYKAALFSGTLHSPAAERRGKVRIITCALIRAELRGLAIGCSCPLERECFVDVLLEVANSRAEETAA